jgi:hypothetical protein
MPASRRILCPAEAEGHGHLLPPWTSRLLRAAHRWHPANYSDCRIVRCRGDRILEKRNRGCHQWCSLAPARKHRGLHTSSARTFHRQGCTSLGQGRVSRAHREHTNGSAPTRAGSVLSRAAARSVRTTSRTTSNGSRLPIGIASGTPITVDHHSRGIAPPTDCRHHIRGASRDNAPRRSLAVAKEQLTVLSAAGRALTRLDVRIEQGHPAANSSGRPVESGRGCRPRP